MDMDLPYLLIALTQPVPRGPPVSVASKCCKGGEEGEGGAGIIVLHVSLPFSSLSLYILMCVLPFPYKCFFFCYPLPFQPFMMRSSRKS